MPSLALIGPTELTPIPITRSSRYSSVSST